jgi:hypothetical protein
MTTHDWRARLRDGDPWDGDLAAAAAAEVRQHVLRAVVGAPASLRLWPRPLAVGATLAFVVAAGAAAGRQLRPSAATELPRVATARAEAAEERRQLQFSTPGGTRIIWVFDPQFTMKESMP